MFPPGGSVCPVLPQTDWFQDKSDQYDFFLFDLGAVLALLELPVSHYAVEKNLRAKRGQVCPVCSRRGSWQAHGQYERKAAAIAQFRLAVISSVIHELYPDASHNAYYERITGYDV